VRYRCRSGEVVWVSAKQTASGRKGKALKREGSSQVAATWLQSHRNPLRCDGKKHTARFRVDRREEGSKGRLVAGQAWVQFCITERDAINLSHSAFVTVR
jgi:hypothetical protein